MASTLLAMASNLQAMASNLIATGVPHETNIPATLSWVPAKWGGWRQLGEVARGPVCARPAVQLTFFSVELCANV